MFYLMGQWFILMISISSEFNYLLSRQELRSIGLVIVVRMGWGDECIEPK